jgi:hypothetical protein
MGRPGSRGSCAGWPSALVRRTRVTALGDPVLPHLSSATRFGCWRRSSTSRRPVPTWCTALTERSSSRGTTAAGMSRSKSPRVPPRRGPTNAAPDVNSRAPPTTSRLTSDRSSPTSVVSPDDPVADDEPLLRRVLTTQLEWHADFGRHVPALAALSFDPDGLSVSREELLRERGLDATALLAGRPGYAFRSRAAWWRDRECDVVPDPNDETEIGFAHALVTLPPGKTKLGRRERNDLAAMMELAAGELPPPPAA